MHQRDPAFWNRANIILLAILIEHLIIGLKVLIALVIPDTPAAVISGEYRRTKVAEEVNRELLELKFKGNHKTFQEMTEEL